MGTLYIFRGIAGTGKTTLSNLLARGKSIPVLRKDDIIDALRYGKKIGKGRVDQEACYQILYQIAQTNLNLGCDFILDIGLGDRENAITFFKRLRFGDNRVFSFLIDCSDREEWKRRHLLRLENPLPHESFQSIGHVLSHYQNADTTPFDGEYSIDTASASPTECFNQICKIIGHDAKK